MDNSIDYSVYTLNELIQAKDTIDREAFPERAAEIDRQLEIKSQEATASSNQSWRIQQNLVRRSDVKFHGNAKEYFSIWIVNLLLTIATLGIYSAWAKVRTNRYFYANLEVDQHRFSYLAQPLQILKGRIIGLALFASYFLISSFSPFAGLLVMLVLFAVTPFLICQSIKFNMRMTGYRNIRFGFHGKFGEAFLVFFLYPLICVFTLYLAMPWALKKMDEFIVGNTSFGEKSFSTEISAFDYFKASFGATLIAIAISLFAFFVFNIDFALTTEPDAGLDFSMLAIFATYVVIFVVASSYYTATVRNHLFALSSIENVATFKSTVSFADLLKLKATNMLLLVVTAGLAMPWVKVRNTAFFANATQVGLYDGADQVMVDTEQSASAVGDEVANAFDMDVALG